MDTFHSWLRDELHKTVACIVEMGGIKCSSRSAEIPTHANFQVQFDDQNLYGCIYGLELAVEATTKGIDFTHLLQFYLSEKLDLIRSFGYRGVEPSLQTHDEPHFAFLPIYRKINPTHPPKSSAELGYLSRRQLLGTVRDPMNRPQPVRKLDPTFDQVRLLSGSFTVEVSQHVTFRAPEWPGNAEILRMAISEAIESFFEILETNSGVTPPVAM